MEGEMQTEFMVGNLKERDHLEIHYTGRKHDGRTWIGLIWLSTGRSGGIL
jgi:hypothetical protein